MPSFLRDVLRVGIVVAALLATPPALAAPGDPDPTFDGDGALLDDLGSHATGGDVVVQPDGKIVVAGGHGAGASIFTLVRYEEDGSRDTSFGTNGVAMADFGSGGSEFAVALRLTAGGAIVAAGMADDRIALARFDTVGVLDASFGAGGMTTTDVPDGTGERTFDLVELPDGRIVVGGFVAVDSQPPLKGLLVGYGSDGTLDPAFGTDGVTISNDTAFVFALAVVKNRINAAAASNGRFALARFTLAGAPNGITRIEDRTGSARAIAIDPRGRAVVAGGTYDEGSGIGMTTLARFTSSGALDPSFGIGGIASADLSQGSSDDGADALVLQPDGAMIVAGTAWNNPPHGPPSWRIGRFGTDGVLDGSFGSGGIVAGGVGQPEGVALQPDGKLIVAGTRYEEYPSLAGTLEVRRLEAVPTACDPAPRTGCVAPVAPGASSLAYQRLPGKTPQLKWKWKKGGAIASGALGDPTVDGPYALCGYDDTTDALLFDAHVAAGGTCRGKPCWRPTGATAWQYKDADGTRFAIAKLAFKEGGAGTSQASVQGKQSNLPTVPLPLSVPARIQLQAPTGACVEATFGADGASANTSTRFVGKSD
jgi:uncharacterized delta-60 repeat protein